MERRIKQTKYGLGEDPRGLIVVMPDWKGRQLLGRVRGFERCDTRGCVELTVDHFCGDPWPLKPVLSAVWVVE